MTLDLRKPASLLCFLLLFISPPVIACIWDRDTLAEEARAHGNIVDVLTGRFPRNPPIYFQMRLDRVREEILKAPQKLALYDDAGVACDRLNRGAEAMWWMEQKRTVLIKAEKSDEVKDHWYRYHANLGTFQAHEWIRGGAPPANMALMAEGARNIEQAIKLNPKAHFGREKYQLKFMNWILSNPDPILRESQFSEKPATFLDDLIHQSGKPSAAKKKELKEASSGLIGLVQLGNAWESIDVFYLLSSIHTLLDNASIHTLAFDRVKELRNLGKRPVLAGNRTKDQIERLYSYPRSMGAETEVPVRSAKLRENAEQWQAERTAYMVERLEKGQHPDTHDDFWDEYKEVARLKLPKP